MAERRGARRPPGDEPRRWSPETVVRGWEDLGDSQSTSASRTMSYRRRLHHSWTCMRHACSLSGPTEVGRHGGDEVSWRCCVLWSW
jgi:hypothetical protein